MVLVVGTLMIFGALFLTFVAFGSMSGQSHGVARSLEMLDTFGGGADRADRRAREAVR